MAYKDIKPYSDFAHIASLNGGPQKYINDIEQNSFAKGLSQGRSKGRLEGIGVCGCSLALLLGAGYAGKALWNKHQAKKEEERKLEEKAEIAKTKLMENIEKNDVEEQVI